MVLGSEAVHTPLCADSARAAGGNHRSLPLVQPLLPRSEYALPLAAHRPTRALPDRTSLPQGKCGPEIRFAQSAPWGFNK